MAVAWRRAPRTDPLASMPAELADFDPKEWAEPGEHPDYDLWRSRMSDDGSYYRCHQRYMAATQQWFDEHPDASFLEWLRRRRVTRIAQP